MQKSTRLSQYLVTIIVPKVTLTLVISRNILIRRHDLGGTFKADGIGKGGGQEGGHSKAGVVFLSQGPTLQEPGEGTCEGGRKLAAPRPSLPAPGHHP